MLNNIPRIFISSTVYDLKDVRGAVKYVLESLGLIVFCSEFSDFAITLDKHSYDVCFSNLRKCDLVLVFIDKRYGGIWKIENKGNPVLEYEISITRQEVREANSANIPIVTFVSKKIWEERNNFKLRIKGKLLTNDHKNRIFTDFKTETKAEADKYFVYDFIDEIQRLTKNNWIFHFESSYDLLDTISKQFPNFLSHINNSNFSGLTSDFLEENSQDLFEEFLNKSKVYKDTNLKIIRKLLPKLKENAISRNQALVEISRLSNKQFQQFVFGYKKIPLYTSQNSNRVLITDSSMERIGSNVWMNSKYHQQILTTCQQLIDKNRSLQGNFFRILLISEPWRVINDDTWFNSLRYVIEFHRKANIGIGVIKRSCLPFKYGDMFINFFLIPNKFVAILELIAGLAFEINYQESSGIISDFTELSEMICTKLDNEEDGFWIKKHLSLEDVKKLIIELMLNKSEKL